MRELASLVQFARQWFDFSFYKITNRLLQELLFFCKIKIHLASRQCRVSITVVGSYLQLNILLSLA